MCARSPSWRAAVVIASALTLSAGSWVVAPPAHAAPAQSVQPAGLPLPFPPLPPGVPNPCDLPGAEHICDIPGDVLGGAGDAIMHAITAWVTEGAVWITTQVGDLINATASPDVEAPWFRGQYGAMLAVASMLALPLLLLAVIQSIMRQDIWLLVRSAFGYLPMAFILAAVSIAATQLLITITDDLAKALVSGLSGSSDNVLKSVGDAFDHAINDQSNDGLPLFGIFLGAIVLTFGSLVLWLELVIRDATIYIALFFLPLTFVAMIWPATSRYARRLVEFLIAVILSKLVIVAIIGLAAAALTNSGLLQDPGAGGAPQDGQLFERMVAGGALIVLASYSPFALLRAIPLVEGAMASVGQTKRQATAAAAAGAGGVQSTASHLKQAMSRQPESFQGGPARFGTTAPAGSGQATPATTSWTRAAQAHDDSGGPRHAGGNGATSPASTAGAPGSPGGGGAAGRPGAPAASAAPSAAGRSRPASDARPGTTGGRPAAPEGGNTDSESQRLHPPPPRSDDGQPPREP